MEAALEFYAEPSNYATVPEDHPSVGEDGGEIARAALKAARGEPT
jgi:hypothetical protein